MCAAGGLVDRRPDLRLLRNFKPASWWPAVTDDQLLTNQIRAIALIRALNNRWHKLCTSDPALFLHEHWWLGMPESEIRRVTWRLDRSRKPRDQSLAWWADRARAVTHEVLGIVQCVSRPPAGRLQTCRKWFMTVDQTKSSFCARLYAGRTTRYNGLLLGGINTDAVLIYLYKNNNVQFQVMRHDMSWVLS